MTEYEMVYLLNEFLNFLETIIETFITLLFAFVIVGYMASAKLTRPMVWFIVFVFSLLALRYISGWYTYSADVTALSEQAFQAKLQPGTALGFLFTKISPTSLSLSFNVTLVGMILSYIGSIVFFFYARQHPREVSE